MWWRVFGMTDASVRPAGLVEHLHAQGLAVVPEFRGDDLGWTAAQLRLPGGGGPVNVERYLTAEDDIRDDLNTWAAWLETADYNPNHQRLMEQVIGTRQLFTLRRPIDHPNEAALDRLCVEVCHYLARQTEGVYQVDGKGFFAADGTLLLEEY